MTGQRKKQAKLIRGFRRIHKYLGIFLFVFFMIIALTGWLLGWKKHSGDMIMPENRVGTVTTMKQWKSIDTLTLIANTYLKDSISADLSLEIEKIEIRPTKGMVKFIYADHNWSIQLDPVTGDPLVIGKRYSDLIESMHDGSLVDDLLKNTNGYFKLFYTNILSIALLVFTLTGFWIWYGPKRMKRKGKK